jgi:hypothetical protein
MASDVNQSNGSWVAIAATWSHYASIVNLSECLELMNWCRLWWKWRKVTVSQMKWSHSTLWISFTWWCLWLIMFVDFHFMIDPLSIVFCCNNILLVVHRPLVLMSLLDLIGTSHYWQLLSCKLQQKCLCLFQHHISGLVLLCARLVYRFKLVLQS